mmetsp:Transcript_5449/g.12132  ORF Transcript_5449/g.12132 Transcript_5449/m.12132 type:complete len:242 (-) Transcript_5449:395-1120(-)
MGNDEFHNERHLGLLGVVPVAQHDHLLDVWSAAGLLHQRRKARVAAAEQLVVRVVVVVPQLHVQHVPPGLQVQHRLRPGRRLAGVLLELGLGEARRLGRLGGVGPPVRLQAEPHKRVRLVLAQTALAEFRSIQQVDFSHAYAPQGAAAEPLRTPAGDPLRGAVAREGGGRRGHRGGGGRRDEVDGEGEVAAGLAVGVDQLDLGLDGKGEGVVAAEEGAQADVLGGEELMRSDLVPIKELKV